MVNKDHVRNLFMDYFLWHGDVDIMEDGGINVGGNVTLTKTPPGGVLPVKFGIVDGVFRADRKGLTSLRNAPDTCEALHVSSNQISSLAHVPEYLVTLEISNNALTNFMHFPEQVQKVFAHGNPLKSLEGLPEHPEEPYQINITYDKQLPLLRLLSAQAVHLGMTGGGYAHLTRFKEVNNILDKYLGQGKPGALKCAAELIRAGYKENARW
jgi:hypothetical protein